MSVVIKKIVQLKRDLICLSLHIVILSSEMCSSVFAILI